MKKSRIFVSVLLILLVVVAWIVRLSSAQKDAQRYRKYLDDAEAFFEEHLYQKAIASYEDALKIEKSKSNYDLLLKAYRLAYEDNVVPKSKYIDAIDDACSNYPKESKYWEELLSVYVENAEYSNAYSTYKASLNAGAKSDKLVDLFSTVKYSYTSSRKTFSTVMYSPDGYYTVFDDTHWGIMRPDGEWFLECIYDFLSPAGESLNVYLSTSKDNRVIDKSAIVQKIISRGIVKAKALSENKLPVMEKGKWRFLDINTEKMSGQYDDVTSFTDGTAMVLKDKVWTMVDSELKELTGKKFTAVKMYTNGEFLCDNRFIASNGKVYSLYKTDGSKVFDFPGKNTDLNLGDYIAYQDNKGLWGFVDQKGNIVIEPEYKGAKSFSYGMGAIYDGENWGYINSDGKTVIDCQYKDVGYFSPKGVCFVSDCEGLYHLIKMRY